MPLRVTSTAEPGAALPAMVGVLSAVLLSAGVPVSDGAAKAPVMLPMTKETLLLTSPPSVLALPAASLNLPLSTAMTALTLAIALGVKVAV